jgi:hypothetical protein
VICPGCKRDNRAARRYCGRCGCNFEPACDGCGFANDRDDRFCGGCGCALHAREAHARPAVPAARHLIAAAPATPAATAAAQSPAWDAGELAELFAPAAVAAQDGPDLPEAGIGQNDVDRLFGGVA